MVVNLANSGGKAPPAKSRFGNIAEMGVPLAVLLASRLRDLLYAVGPFDPLTIGVVLGTLLLVVMAASIVPARRATLIDPAQTMRTE